jgi:hypothetical protein|tara:strand:+ start:271 stop:384 length:114 start_codon:yes stop_codon:yes gene_type:complete
MLVITVIKPKLVDKLGHEGKNNVNGPTADIGWLKCAD